MMTLLCLLVAIAVHQTADGLTTERRITTKTRLVDRGHQMNKLEKESGRNRKIYLIHVANKEHQVSKPFLNEKRPSDVTTTLPTAPAFSRGLKPSLLPPRPCRAECPSTHRICQECSVKRHHYLTVSLPGIPCTWKIPTTVCHGECTSYSVPKTARHHRHSGILSFEYKHGCQSCQTGEIVYHARRLTCVAMARPQTIRVPQAKSCFCRVCSS
eukprot:m.230664 g.230664  ORF g.230664 m.230664 type:complete len:213 (+) comp40060_c0_seq8:1107-1745(+)